MIRRVLLRQWKSHLSTELRFEKGINALFGSIGAGKSSILDGMCFALFGTFPALQSKKVKLDDVIMSRPSIKNSAEVEVEFEFDGKTYTVRRRVERGKGTTYAELRENGKLLEAPNASKVTECVERILRTNYELFSKATYAEQNSIDYFLNLPKGERKRKFDNLLFLDRFEVARTNAVTLMNRLLSRKDGVEQTLRIFNLEELEKSVSRLKEEIGRLEGELEEKRRELSKVEIRKGEAEAELGKLKEIKRKLDEKASELKGKEGAVSELEKSVKFLEKDLHGESFHEVKKRFKEVEKRVKDLEFSRKEKQELLRKLSSEVSERKARASLLQGQLEDLERRIHEIRSKEDFKRFKEEIGSVIEKEMEEKGNKYNELLQDEREISVKIKECEETLSKLERMGKKCPLCLSPITDERREELIKERKEALQELNLRLIEVQDELKRLKREIKNLKDVRLQWERARVEVENLKEMETTQQRLKEELIAVRSALERSVGKLKEVEEDAEELEQALEKERERKRDVEILLLKFQELEHKRSRLYQLRMEVGLLRSEVEKLSKELEGKDLEGLGEQLRMLEARERELKTSISYAEKTLEAEKARLKELEEKVSEVRKKVEEVERIERILKDLELFRRALVLTQVRLREDFLQAVNYFMNKIWATLYPYGDFTEIRLAIVEDDYVLQLRDRNGRFVNVDGIASGGERSIACLALRMAFSSVLAPQLKLLVLDEPTHNLDARSVQVLGRALMEKAVDIAEQIFLITHDERLEEMILGKIYRVERDKESDGVSRVKEVV